MATTNPDRSGVSLCRILLSGAAVLLVASPVAAQRPRPAAVVQPAVERADPSRVALKPGGDPVEVLLAGPGLETSSGAVVQVDGDLVGYQTFAFDSGGNAPGSVTVAVVAHPSARDGLKSSVSHYACALAFQPAWTQSFLSVHPAQIGGYDAYQSLVAADGSVPQGWQGGAFPGR